MANEAANPALSAQGINDLVTWSIRFFREQVEMYLRAAYAEKFLPLSTPAKNKAEERALLEAQEPQLQQQAMNPDAPASLRALAHKQLLRLMELRTNGANNGNMP